MQGKSYENSGICHTDEFKRDADRSVKVEKCVKRPKDILAVMKPRDRLVEFPVEWEGDWLASWRVVHGEMKTSDGSDSKGRTHDGKGEQTR